MIFPVPKHLGRHTFTTKDMATFRNTLGVKSAPSMKPQTLANSTGIIEESALCWPARQYICHQGQARSLQHMVSYSPKISSHRRNEPSRISVQAMSIDIIHCLLQQLKGFPISPDFASRANSAILAYVPQPRMIIPMLKTTRLQIAAFKLCFSYQWPFLRSTNHSTGGM